MKIIAQPEAMQAEALACRRRGHTIGLVPTMGYLHEGHMSLVQIARREADVVVVSLFVNPTQFGPAEDFSAYPRDFERDAACCRAAGVDVLFCPDAGTMYAADHSVCVDEERLSRGLCGAARPGHFRGVCTVVAMLFNLTLPDVAVFGEKDAQQLRVLRRMVRDLHFPVRVVPGPIVREPDGLAMSSRNKYLSPTERREALCLRRALDRAERAYADGVRDPAALGETMRDAVAEAPSARVDYVEIVDEETLEPALDPARPWLAALAVYVGRTRLIDNAVLGAESRRERMPS